MPDKKEGQGRLTVVSKDTAMDDMEKKLQTLLDYWIEHNGEHEQEFRDWADKVASSSAEVAKQLQKAAVKMASVSDELAKAKQALSKSKGGH
jgi:uncharacterized protein YukE